MLPLGEALARLQARTLPPRAVALTFDDGTQDFARRAAPLLAVFGMPATVYVPAYYCGREQPIFDTALRGVTTRSRLADPPAGEARAAPLLRPATGDPRDVP